MSRLGSILHQRVLLPLLCVLAVAPVLSASSVISGSASVHKCETNAYTITVTNTSGSPITNIVVHNLIPTPGFSYVTGSSSISGACTSSANPTIIGNELRWTLDTLCGPGFTLNPAQSVTIVFSLYAACNAVSGSDNVTVDYIVGGVPASDVTAMSITVLPGAVTITKTPNVIAAALGDPVAWTLRIENTGLGRIRNVVVTDVLGSGLTYTSSLPAGVNAGATTTWTSTEIPALALMNPGDAVTIAYNATVTACNNLDNTADVRWGCDDSTICFNTATDGGTATASVARIVRTPLIVFTPPPISFSYCTNSTSVSFPVTNSGDGTAYNPRICVDFGTVGVASVTGPATYSSGCFNLPNIPPGGTYNLQFNLSYSGWCGGSFPAGTLIWQPLYEDDCANPFYPPVVLSTISTSGATPSLTVSKTGPSVIQIGATVTYAIDVTYAGPTSCGSGTTGIVTVTDTVPAGFTVTNSGGGTWTPGGGGTGGAIVWTFDPTVTTTLSTSITLQSPGITECETYCFTLFANSVSASVVDCCGCTLTGSASVTTAIECEQLVNSEKTASPVTNEKCTNVSYTNSYTFENNAALDSVLLNSLTFTENAENNQDYVPGSLSVIFDGSDVTACVTVTDTTPGGTLFLDFSGCAASTVRARVLTISYQLTVTPSSLPNPPCGAAYTFYSWSTLDMGTISGQCLQDAEIHETTLVTFEPPAMTISFSGMPTVADTCGTYDVDMTVTRTSTTAVPYDVLVRLATNNYYVVTVLGYTGLSPVSGPTSFPTYVEWNYADLFSAGNQTVIRLRVQKRCTGGPNLDGSVYFDDRCNDDASAGLTCSATASASPQLLLTADLLIEKMPEVYYATTSLAQWTIYLTNRGNGTAYNVWIDDVLGTGLQYVSSTISGAGTTTTANLNHTGGVINGVTWGITSMPPGERREITLTANVINCTGLTNDVTANWGCVGSDCRPPVTDSSTVEIPTGQLVNTNTTVTPVNACATNSATIVLKNAGQTTLYNLIVSEALPAGMTYVLGSTEWRLNAGAWTAGSDPVPTTSPLQWNSTQLPTLASITAGSTIEIRFQIYASCTFSGGNFTVQASYENPCGNVFSSAASSYLVDLRTPNVTITKTRTSPGPGPLTCGQSASWQITVTNNSGYTLPILWVRDTLGGAFAYVSSTGDPTYGPADGGVNAGQLVYWEITNLPTATTAVLTLTAQTDSAPCSNDLVNTVIAWWGCGAVDGSSTTNPTTEPGACLAATGVTATNTSTRQPTMNMNVTVSPLTVDSCGGSGVFTITINNTGTTDANNVDLRITLPTGLTYVPGSSTVTCPGGGSSSADPLIVGNQLTYYNSGSTATNMCNLIGAGQSATIQLTLDADCYRTANLALRLYYYDCCNDQQYTTNTNTTITANQPILTLTKTPASVDLDCGNPLDTVTWTLTVNNTGTGTAGWIRVQDVLGSSLVYDSSSPAATSMGGNQYGWEVGPVAPGGSQVFTITAHATAPASCDTSLTRNSASATWGCGAFDGDPNTTGEYDCQSGVTVNATAQVDIADLAIISTDIVPAFTCTSDGVTSGAIAVTVRNTGNATINSNFIVRVSDNTGWTTDVTVTAPLAAGGSTVLNVPWPMDCMTCSYTVTAELDATLQVCECNETNNTASRAFSTPSDNLRVTSITPTCSADGRLQVQVVVNNNGCTGSPAGVRLTLVDDKGNSSFQNLAALAAGASTTRTFSNWATDCLTATISFTATVDSQNTLCECTLADNAMNLIYNVTAPNLVPGTITPSTSCVADGTVTGQFQIQVSNTGIGNVTSDFQITVNDGQGWTATQTFTALGGTLPLTAGSSQTVTMAWGRSFTTQPYVCSFPTITVTLDPAGAICECSSASNAATTSYTMSCPDLTIQAIAPSCTSDGQASVDVTVRNGGCGTATNIVVQLSDNDGNTSSQTVASLAAGAQTTITFSPWPMDGTPATITFTATVDPADAITELSGTNNTLVQNFTSPDLRVVTVTPACTSDMNYTVTVVVANNGSAAVNSPFTVRMADNDGHTVDQLFTAVGGTLPFAAGTQQTLTFTSWVVDCNPTALTFTATIDALGQICELTGSNNTGNTGYDVTDLAVSAINPAISCSSDGNVTGTIAVTVANTGAATINSDFRVSIDDGQGFTANLFYNADLGGPLPLAAGASATVTFTWTRAFTTAPYVCTFNPITAAVDTGSAICECTTTNNTLTTSYTLPLPDFGIVSITPSCMSDGQYSIAVVVDNHGCGTATNVPVLLQDTDGNSQTLTIASIAAGGQSSITFSPWPADGDPALITFTATADPLAAICEMNGSDNSMSRDYERSDLRLVSMTPECAGESHYRITIVVENRGSLAVSTPFNIRLSDNDGHTIDMPFTSLGGTLPFAIGAQQTVVFDNWVVDCDPGTLTFTGLVDSGIAICDSNLANNTTTVNFQITDLEATSLVPTTSCAADGSISGSLALTVTNRGGGAATSDFKIDLNDNNGWTASLWYAADLGGPLPLAGGASATVVIDWPLSIGSTPPYHCQFTGITATVDSTDTICECTPTNNTTTADATLTYPDLMVYSIDTDCVSDGVMSLMITVTNRGCGDASQDFDITLSDSAHRSQTYSFTELGGKLPLAADSTQALIVKQWAFDCSPSSLTFTATADSGFDVCEIDGTNNQLAWTYKLEQPDLLFGDVAWVCNADGTITFTIVVANDGNGRAEGARLAVYDDSGSLIHSQQVSPAGGGSSRVEITVGPYSQGQEHTFRFVVDGEEDTCECDGTNNETTATVKCEITSKRAAIVTSKAFGAGTAGACGLIDVELRVRNVAESDVFNVTVTDTLPPGFEYVPGSTNIRWPAGSSTADPQISGRRLTWETAARLRGGTPLGQELVLRFKLRAPSCETGARVFTNTMRATAEDADGKAVPPKGDDPDDDDPDDSSSAVIRLACPELEAERNCPASTSVGVGETVEYTIVVRNAGEAGSTLKSLRVTDRLPSGWSLESFASDGAQPVSSPRPGATGVLVWTFGSQRIDPGKPIRLTIRIVPAADACGTVFNDDVVVEAEDDCGDPYKVDLPPCVIEVTCGEPRIEIAKECDGAEQPGGIFRFTATVRSTGADTLHDVTLYDRLPRGFSYVPGSSAIDGARAADPSVDGQLLAWWLGDMPAGTTHRVTYSAVVSADTDPGRYCNEARAEGITRNGRTLTTPTVDCCVIVRRDVSGCCLEAEHELIGFQQTPEQMISFVEPYFRTEDAMFTVYGALDLWERVASEPETADDFVRERLRNYALSTVEELYLRSRLGVLHDDGTLRLSAAGAYPQRGAEGPWTGERADWTMTASQVGWELLGLNRAAARVELDQTRQTIRRLIGDRMTFLAEQIEDLPHSWEIKGGVPEDGDGEATLNDRVTLLLAMTELSRAGNEQAAALSSQLNKRTSVLATGYIDQGRLTEELIYMLALQRAGRADELRLKLESLERLLSSGKLELRTMREHALAVYVDSVCGGTLYGKLFASLHEKYYRRETAIFAIQESDFRYTLETMDLGAIFLAAQTQMPQKDDSVPYTLLRMFEETGLFLKKKDEETNRTPLVLLRNSPPSVESPVVLAIERADENMAPVFSESVMIESPFNPGVDDGAVMPFAFTKVLSPSYEPEAGDVAALSTEMQHLGRELGRSPDRLVREAGRSLDEYGKRYLTSILFGGSGIEKDGWTVVPFTTVAVKGTRAGAHTMEPVVVAPDLDTRTLAEYMVAARLYVEGGGRYATAVKQVQTLQRKIVARFGEIGYVPARFRATITEDETDVTLIPSKERAGVTTIARLLYAQPDQFLRSQMRSPEEALTAGDIYFASISEEAAGRFEDGLRAYIGKANKSYDEIAAEVVARRILEKSDRDQIEKLLEIWDPEVRLPRSDLARDAGRARVMRYGPEAVLLYIEALRPTEHVRLKRTLSMFGSLFETEWSLNWEAAHAPLPPAEFWLLKESPKQAPEPGDMLVFDARIWNHCIVSRGRSRDLGSLRMATTFNPALVYAGTDEDPEVTVLGDFLWKAGPLIEGGEIDYRYRAYLPRRVRSGYIEGLFRVRGIAGHDQPIDFESDRDDYCEYREPLRRLPVNGLQPLSGLVFHDRNVNGIREEGEEGIPGVLVKDTRGRVRVTDSEGRFEIEAGDEQMAVQVELKSVPAAFIMTTEPTRLVDRRTPSPIVFGMVRCVTVTGTVFRDTDGDGKRDENEAGVVTAIIDSRQKQTVSGSGGIWTLHNVPEGWVSTIRVAEDQPFLQQSAASGLAIEVMIVPAPVK